MVCGYFDFDVVTAADAAYNYVQSAIVGIEPLKQKRIIIDIIHFIMFARVRCWFIPVDL